MFDKKLKENMNWLMRRFDRLETQFLADRTRNSAAPGSSPFLTNLSFEIQEVKEQLNALARYISVKIKKVDKSKLPDWEAEFDPSLVDEE